MFHVGVVRTQQQEEAEEEGSVLEASFWSEVTQAACSLDYLKLGASYSRQELGQAWHTRHQWPLF